MNYRCTANDGLVQIWPTHASIVNDERRERLQKWIERSELTRRHASPQETSHFHCLRLKQLNGESFAPTRPGQRD